MSKYKGTNDIAASTTHAIGIVYPDSGIALPIDDYSPLSIDLDENDNSIVIDFASDYDTEDARGATVRFRRRQLVVLIHMLQAALECLEPGERDDFPDRGDDLERAESNT